MYSSYKLAVGYFRILYKYYSVSFSLLTLNLLNFLNEWARDMFMKLLPQTLTLTLTLRNLNLHSTRAISDHMCRLLIEKLK